MPAFLKHIEVENFKSYKGKLTIGPLKSFTAVVDAVEDGNEKSFMRSVQGSSSEHRINNNVSFTTEFLFTFKCLAQDSQNIFCYRLSPVKCILMSWNTLVLMLKQRTF